MLNLGDTSLWLPSWAAVVFLAVVAKATRTESRTLLAGLIAVTLAPVPESLYAIAALSLVFRVLDLLHIGG